MTNSMEPRSSDLWRALAAACALVASVGLWSDPVAALVDKLSAGRVSWSLPGAGAAPGFNARIETVPSGAEVRVDGQDRGTTPFLGNIVCREGEPVSIEVSKKGFRPWVRNPLCRHGGTLEVTATLEAQP